MKNETTKRKPVVSEFEGELLETIEELNRNKKFCEGKVNHFRNLVEEKNARIEVLEKEYKPLINEICEVRGRLASETLKLKNRLEKETLELREKMAKMEAHYTNIIIARNRREIELEGALRKVEGLFVEAEEKLTEEVGKRKTLLGKLEAPKMLLEILTSAA